MKFKHGEFSRLRERLLADSSNEHFAVMFGRSWKSGEVSGTNVYDVRFFDPSEYESHGLAHLRIKKEVIHDILSDLVARYDVDTLIDVHTHPFCDSNVSFSSVDDGDERRFFAFLSEHFDHIRYASIVLSQGDYSARWWYGNDHQITPHYGTVKTQTRPEAIPSSDFNSGSDLSYEQQVLTETDGMFNRGVLVLGLESMRSMMTDQTITVVGVGGLGSIIAEHLVHMGFHSINLIDPDRLEMSNLNRIVGAYYSDAQASAYKVDIVQRHLTSINPQCRVTAYRKDLLDSDVDLIVAASDWLVIATDNHSSRLRAQRLSIQYYVPIISVGVNITVVEGVLKDVSGEVITLRIGDRLCLLCLNRVNHMKVANESHPDARVRSGLVEKGYITGHDVKEPAVKTLNSMLATLAVDVLINEFTEFQRHVPILVYDGSQGRTIYEDRESVATRNLQCFTCSI